MHVFRAARKSPGAVQGNPEEERFSNCSVFLEREVFLRGFQRKNRRIAGVCPSAQRIWNGQTLRNCHAFRGGRAVTRFLTDDHRGCIIRTCHELIYTSCLSDFPISASESLAVARYGCVFFLDLEKSSCAICIVNFVTVPKADTSLDSFSRTE